MKVSPALWKNVKVNDGLLKERQITIANVTLAHVLEQYEHKGRLGASTWKTGMPNSPHFFYDSDVAKLIEAAAYSMFGYPDPALKAKLEKTIDDLIAIQEPDGYLNSYFHNVAPDRKWTDLMIKHELYCAGHLMEAAVAWHLAAGEDKLLNAMCRYADLICDKFGPAEGQIHSWPGHPEIELALVRLYNVTGNVRYLKTAEFFVEDRGSDASHWLQEAEKLGVDVTQVKDKLRCFQAHMPAELQDKAEGHAVRACYFYCGMADIALETGNQKLLEACRKIWRNIVDRRMNVTGGIGSNWAGETFTYDYDLPEEYYYETCAQISLFMFAWRMFLNEQRAEYADIMELTLYNSILSGIDAAGKAFFYSNPLVSFKREGWSGDMPKHWGTSVRHEDFNCSCCPPNISRFIASIGQYIYAASPDAVWINLFIDSDTAFDLADGTLSLRMQTEYPWDGRISLVAAAEHPVNCQLHVRIPAWAREFELSVNGDKIKPILQAGYALIERNWTDGDRLELYLPMPVEIIEAHPALRQAAGKVALKRGPVVYCIEETDNGPGVFSIAAASDTVFNVEKRKIAGFELPVLTFPATRRKHGADEALYHPMSAEYETVRITALPYFMWANRGENEMTVWLKRK